MSLFSRLTATFSEDDRHQILVGEVATRSLRGESELEIARTLFLTKELVRALLVECKQLWIERAVLQGGEQIARELAHMERIRAMAYDDYELSRYSRREQALAVEQHREMRADQPGDATYLRTIVTVSERICKLLGIDKGADVNVKLSVGDQLSLADLMQKDDSELARLHSEALTQSEAAQRKS